MPLLVPPEDMPLLSPPVEPLELAPPVDEPEVSPPLELAPPVEEPDVSPVLEAPPDVLPGGVLDAPPEVPPGDVLDAPPVPPDGGVEGAAPGVCEDSDGGVEVAGADELGVLVVPPVVPLWSPPPRLQAAILTVSKPSNTRVRETCKFGFIAIPFN